MPSRRHRASPDDGAARWATPSDPPAAHLRPAGSGDGPRGSPARGHTTAAAVSPDQIAQRNRRQALVASAPPSRSRERINTAGGARRTCTAPSARATSTAAAVRPPGGPGDRDVRAKWPGLGLIPAARRERGRERRLKRPERPADRPRARSRAPAGAGGGQPDRARRVPAPAAQRRAATDRAGPGDRIHSPTGCGAEKAERQMQRLGRGQPQTGHAGNADLAATRRAPPARRRAARARRTGAPARPRWSLVLGARCHVVAWTLVMLTQQQAPQEVHRDGDRPIAHVTPSAGHLGAARDHGAVGGEHRDADQPDGFLVGAAVGSGDPGDPDPELCAKSRSIAP